MLRSLFVVAVNVVCAATYAFEPGQSVIVVRPAQVMDEAQVVDLVPVGAELKIQSVAGNWVWVSHGKSGWVKNDRVMLPAQALEHFNSVLRAQPGRLDVLFARANVHRTLDEHDEAMADFNRLIRVSPQAAAYNGRGRTWFDLGNYESAIADFTRAIELDPDNAMLYNNRSAAWEKKGDHQRALADLDEAHRHEPGHDLVEHNRSRLQNRSIASQSGQ